MNHKMSPYYLTIILIGISMAQSPNDKLCDNEEDFVYGAQYRPIAVEATKNICYWAFSQGPCAENEWFILRQDTETKTLTHIGQCTERSCVDTTAEVEEKQEEEEKGQAHHYESYTFIYNGTCLRAGSINFPYCGGEKLLYFSSAQLAPVCKESISKAPEGKFLASFVNNKLGSIMGHGDPVRRVKKRKFRYRNSKR